MPRSRPISRPLTTHIGAWRLGLAPSCVFITTYPDEGALPTEAWLRARIRKIHNHYPFLTATFEESGMLHETQADDIDYDWFIQNRSIEDARRDAQAVRREAGANDDDDPTDAQYILEAETIRWRSVFGLGKPMWQVVRYLPEPGGPQASGAEQDRPVYLAFTIAHIIADGVGCLNAALVLLEPDAQFDQRPKEDFFALEDDPEPVLKDLRTLRRFDMPQDDEKSSTSARPVPDPSVPQENWPQVAMPLDKEARFSPLMYCHVSIPQDVVQAVKAAGKAHGIPTVTPAMCVGLLHAIGTVYAPPHLALAAERDQLALTCLLAACDRDNMDGVSHIFGGFLTAFREIYAYPPDPAASFWDVARQISQGSRSAERWAEHRAARVERFSRPREELMDPQYLLDHYGGLSPPWFSATLSTLGAVQLPPGSVDFDWMASFPPVQYQSMGLLTAGHEKGTRAHLAWAEGCAVDTPRQREVMRRWEVIMRRLAAGAETMSELQDFD